MKNVAQIYLLIGLGMSLLAVGCDQAIPAEPTSVPDAPAMRHARPHRTPGPQVVRSLNALTGDVILAAGSNVTITPSDNTLTIAASAAGGNTLDQAYDQGGAGAGKTITADAGPVRIVQNSAGFAPFSLTQLAVENSFFTGIHMMSAADGVGTILFGSPTEDDRGFITYNHDTDFMILGAGGGSKVFIDVSGNVGIGTTPSEKLHVVGDALANNHTIPSSRRWKENIAPIEGALDKVQRLRGVSYNWKATGEHNIGVIAEEVGMVIPEVVTYEENRIDAKAVDYGRLVAVLIEAIKEQQNEIDELKAVVRSLAAERE